jgi:ATP-dependent RNA helicase RhlE
MSFSSMGLSQAVLQGVHTSGYETPTQIQADAIPHALKGKDILGCAPTGTGKTAAFVLPMLCRLDPRQQNGKRQSFLRALILTPTRELAQQIEDSIITYGKFVGMRTLAVYGGASMHAQLMALRRGIDIVVATPGRLIDHLNRRSIDLSHVEILVIDEADRMFDMGFIQAVRSIIARVPRQRQTLLFAATMSDEVRGLMADIQHDPQIIEIGELNSPVETVDQHFYAVPQQSKMDLLVHVLRDESVETALVFSRTKHGADRISKRLLHHGISAATIHANRSQSQRQHALDGFKRREYRVLVATDLAARGIDVEAISHVVNYDTPTFPEDYIHRIGRTGRAESTGTAFTFVADEEKKFLKRIEYLARRRFELKRFPGFAGGYPAPEAAAATAPSAARSGRFFQRRKGFRRNPFNA